MGKPSTYTKELKTFKACEKLPVTLGVSVDFPGYTAFLSIYNGLVTIQPHNRESVQCTKFQFLFKERCMHVQCRHIILALNLWADRALYTTACPIATHFLGYGCRKDLITIHTFDLQSTWVIDMFRLSCLYVIRGCLYDQAVADVRSTSAGIKCLYCTAQSACAVINSTWVMEK